MTLAASAWRMRQAAAQARQLSARAQEICYTAGGKRLEALSAWLAGGGFFCST